MNKDDVLSFCAFITLCIVLLPFIIIGSIVEMIVNFFTESEETW